MGFSFPDVAPSEFRRHPLGSFSSTQLHPSAHTHSFPQKITACFSHTDSLLLPGRLVVSLILKPPLSGQEIPTSSIRCLGPEVP